LGVLAGASYCPRAEQATRSGLEQNTRSIEPLTLTAKPMFVSDTDQATQFMEIPSSRQPEKSKALELAPPVPATTNGLIHAGLVGGVVVVLSMYSLVVAIRASERPKSVWQIAFMPVYPASPCVGVVENPMNSNPHCPDGLPI
jgi:hypothetical protein